VHGKHIDECVKRRDANEVESAATRTLYGIQGPRPHLRRGPGPKLTPNREDDVVKRRHASRIEKRDEDREPDIHGLRRVSRQLSTGIAAQFPNLILLPRSSGLGLSTVECILQEKGYVAILDLKQPDIAAIGLTANKVKFYQLDITQVEDIVKVVEQVVSWTKQTGAFLAGIINCAGVGTAAKVGEVLCFTDTC
jgi:hypothetical protein